MDHALQPRAAKHQASPDANLENGRDHRSNLVRRPFEIQFDVLLRPRNQSEPIHNVDRAVGQEPDADQRQPEGEAHRGTDGLLGPRFFHDGQQLSRDRQREEPEEFAERQARQENQRIQSCPGQVLILRQCPGGIRNLQDHLEDDVHGEQSRSDGDVVLSTHGTPLCVTQVRRDHVNAAASPLAEAFAAHGALEARRAPGYFLVAAAARLRR